MANSINTVDFMIILIGVLLILVKLPIFFNLKDSQVWIRKRIASPRKKLNVQYMGVVMLVLFGFFSFYILQTMNLARALAAFVVFTLFFCGLTAIAFPKYIQHVARFWGTKKELRIVSLFAAILGIIMIVLVTYWPYR